MTLTVQLAPAATVAGATGQVVLDIAKSGLSKVMLVIDIGTALVTITVTGCVALGVLISWGAKTRGFGESVAVDKAPVPCTGRSDLPPVALSITWIALFLTLAAEGV